MTSTPTDPKKTGKLPLVGKLLDASRNSGPALPDPETLDASDAEAYAQLKARRAERRRKKLIHRGIAAGVIVAVVAVGALVVALTTKQPEESFAPITDVAYAGTYLDAVEARGSLEPLSSTAITPAVDGTIAEVRVAAGQHVNAGDVLMVIDNPDLDAAVAEAKRTLDAAQSELAAAKRARSDAYAAAKQPVLDEEGNEVSPVVDTATAEDTVKAAERAVASAQASYDQAVAKAAERTVTAPIDGSVVTMNAQVGASPMGGGENGASGPVMQIADLSQMKVTIQVSEEDIARVAVGQETSVTFPAFDDIMLTGTVQNIASIASSGGDTYAMGDGSSVAGYVRENFTSVVSLLASMFVLCVIVYFYYFFERKEVLADRADRRRIMVTLDALSGLAVLAAVGAFAGETLSVSLGVLGILLGGVLYAWGGRRTEAGLLLREEILGLRSYLRKGEVRGTASDLRQDPDCFFNLLPWALALGVDKAFARNMGGRKLPDCPYVILDRQLSYSPDQWCRFFRQLAKDMERRKVQQSRSFVWELLSSLTGKPKKRRR